MKTINSKSFFKKVSAKQAELNPAMGAHVGKKRPDVNWSFEGFASFEDVSAANPEHILHFLNAALESFGKDLIVENAANWDYVPTGITLAAAYEAATAKAERSRTLTKVTAAAFAEFYGKHAPTLLGIPVASAEAAKVVLVDWLTYSRKENFRAAMFARLNQLAEAICELDETSEILEAFTTGEIILSDVLSALIKAFDVAETTETISADAL